MTQLDTSLNHAKLAWQNGMPHSTEFGDIYFSRQNPVAESDYVFLHGCSLQQALETKSHLTIGETGFGTGLNFLATWQAWKMSTGKPRLVYVSTEKFPLTLEDLKKSHRSFDKFSLLNKQLQDKWPPPARGFHPIDFEDGKITLILLFGDTAEMLQETIGPVDIWYLDGFAPAKNSSMWSDAVFTQIARLSSPGARLATFTAAGFVKRGLQEKGFTVSKTKGYGHKRDRLIATYTSNSQIVTNSKPDNNGPIAIIGDGFSGAFVAHSLKKRGLDVEIFANSNTRAASDVPAAILAPRFLLGPEKISDFLSASFVYSVHHQLIEPFILTPKGVSTSGKNEKENKRLKEIFEQFNWGSHWMQWSDGALYLPKSGAVIPSAVRSAAVHEIKQTQAIVTGLNKSENGWQLSFDSGKPSKEFQIVVVAAGLATLDLLNEHSPELRPNLGHVMQLPANSFSKNTPEGATAFGGYITPSHENMRILGSTYERLKTVPNDMPQPTQKTKEKLIEKLLERTNGNAEGSAEHFWSGLRATTPDHIPYFGPIPDTVKFMDWATSKTPDANRVPNDPAPMLPGIYTVCGIGSKGLQYAPLLGACLAAEICQEVQPLSSSNKDAMSPAKRIIRTIRRRRLSLDKQPQYKKQ